ncbi:hypothetical protein EMIT074MI3_11061 [Bacillus licheniformis]
MNYLFAAVSLAAFFIWNRFIGLVLKIHFVGLKGFIHQFPSV